MRRALRKNLGLLAHLYGIRPWEIDRLSWAEVYALIDDAELFVRAGR